MRSPRGAVKPEAAQPGRPDGAAPAGRRRCWPGSAAETGKQLPAGMMADGTPGPANPDRKHP
jgi:hypothetical protein